MGILNEIQLEREQRLLLEVNDIIKNNRALLDRMKIMHTASFNRIWNNREFTAQEIFDKFGNEAVSLFIYSSQIQNLLRAIDPSYIPLPPPYPYTINEDGTVTVDYEQSSESSSSIDSSSESTQSSGSSEGYTDEYSSSSSQ